MQCLEILSGHTAGFRNLIPAIAPAFLFGFEQWPCLEIRRDHIAGFRNLIPVLDAPLVGLEHFHAWKVDEITLHGSLT